MTVYSLPTYSQDFAARLTVLLLPRSLQSRIPEPRLNLLFSSLFRSAGNFHDNDSCSNRAVALATVSRPFESMRSISHLGDGRAAPRLDSGVAAETARVHTPTMTLKSAALLALIGTILMTALLLWTFVLTFLNVLRDLVPAVTLFQSFIYAFGCFSAAVFFYVFRRAQ
jgi:hypothetical protein